MKAQLKTIMNRIAGVVVGTCFVVMGFGLIVLGLTFLPVIGIFAGIGLMSLSVYFFNPRAQESVEVIAYTEKNVQWCPWSPELNRAA